MRETFLGDSASRAVAERTGISCEPPQAEAISRSVSKSADVVAAVLAGFGGWLWLAIIIVPIYYVVVTSLKNQAGFFTSNPMLPPAEPTLDNYKLVLAPPPPQKPG